MSLQTIKLAICLLHLCNSLTSSSIVWLSLAHHNGQALKVIAVLTQSHFEKVVQCSDLEPNEEIKAFVFSRNLII